MSGSDYRREKLCSLMDGSGTTLQELADAIGVHWTTIGKYRNGTIKLNKKKRIAAIAAFFNVPVSVFNEPPKGSPIKKLQTASQELPVQDKIEIIMQHHDNFLGKLFISCVNYFYQSLCPVKEQGSVFNLPESLQHDEIKKELAEIKNAILLMHEGKAPPTGNVRPFLKATTRKTHPRNQK